jgi:hypothetical protein
MLNYPKKNQKNVANVNVCILIAVAAVVAVKLKN